MLPEGNGPDRIAAYIASLIQLDHASLVEIDRQAGERADIQPSVGLEVGKLLGLLVRLLNAKQVLEFGTCLGYSTIWLGSALRETGGMLTSVEFRQDLWEATSANVQAAGLQQVVDVIQGDAGQVLDRLSGPFDMILQDSDKALYPLLLERCIQATRIGGVILADDALFPAMEGIPEKYSRPISDYNQLVFHDARLYSTILPIGDGVALSIKLRS